MPDQENEAAAMKVEDSTLDLEKLRIQLEDKKSRFGLYLDRHLADISQITPKFVETVPPFHRQGNCIPSAAIRWPDFGTRPSFGRYLPRFSAIQTHPSCRFHLAVDFPGLRRSGSWSQIINQAQDFPEQFPRHRHLGQLERDVPAMADNFGSDLHQFPP